MSSSNFSDPYSESDEEFMEELEKTLTENKVTKDQLGIKRL
jgi:hypothetical protein